MHAGVRPVKRVSGLWIDIDGVPLPATAVGAADLDHTPNYSLEAQEPPTSLAVDLLGLHHLVVNQIALVWVANYLLPHSHCIKALAIADPTLLIFSAWSR